MSKRSRYATVIAATCVVALLFALILLANSRLHGQASESSSEVNSSISASQDLSMRLNRLVNVQHIDVRGNEALTVDIVIQSSNRFPLESNLDDILQKAIAEREIVLNYQIGPPVRAYTISIAKPDVSEPIFLQIAQTHGSDRSQNLKTPERKLLDDQWISSVVSEAMDEPLLRLNQVVVSQKRFDGSTKQNLDVVLGVESVDRLNDSLENLVLGLFPLIDRINNDPRGDIAIFSLKIIDPQEKQLYGLVLDADLKTYWLQYAEDVKRISPWGRVSGPAATASPDSVDTALTSPIVMPSNR